MGDNLVYKILKSHIVEGELKVGEPIGIKIDQTLTQDSTGTMAYLQLEAMGIDRVKTKRSVAFIDHNMLQQGFENADDHKFIQTVASKYGVYFSKPGNGICHQVFLERFARPSETLTGSDSHTPTAGGVGMLAMGAGGLDVALAMGGGAYYISTPKVVKVNLIGKLNKMVASKDIILEVLRKLTVKGGVNKVFEYAGEGVKTLSVPERATITNMGAELGATTSIFPSDERTLEFFKAQGREEDYIEFKPDADATYDEEVIINLDELKPLTAKPHSPDNVVTVKEAGKIKVDQVFIGSCTNASYTDFVKVAKIMENRVVHDDVSFSIAPGSRQVFSMLLRDGIISKLVASGARVLECGCGPCVGIGQATNTGGISLRTSNRNFKGRGGTLDAYLYLASPEVAAATALTGYITDPRTVIDPGLLENIEEPKEYIIDDNMIIKPIETAESVEIIRGPNIKPMPINEPMAKILNARVVAKCKDNITTDDIIPANAQFSALRSNIPAISEITFGRMDPGFYLRAREYEKSIIVGGENYGQGSSREHAAIAPMYLGVKAVIVKSMARIHKNNLVNHGVMPLLFSDSSDYDNIEQGDELCIEDAIGQIKTKKVKIMNKTKNTYFETVVDLTDREVELIIAGGQLRFVQKKNKASKL